MDRLESKGIWINSIKGYGLIQDVIDGPHFMFYTFFIKIILCNGDNDTFGSQGRENLFYFYLPFFERP